MLKVHFREHDLLILLKRFSINIAGFASASITIQTKAQTVSRTTIIIKTSERKSKITQKSEKTFRLLLLLCQCLCQYRDNKQQKKRRRSMHDNLLRQIEQRTASAKSTRRLTFDCLSAFSLSIALVFPRTSLTTIYIISTL